MTVQEAKMQIQAIPSKIWEQLSPCDNEAMGIAIESMEEVEQYRALGTVEELKEAREKQVAKKPKIIKHKHYNSHTCPFCDLELICSDETGWFSGKRHKYCHDCGQALKWGEEDD